MCYSLPVRLAFDAIEEVEPEVTAAAAAAIEVDVGKAVMDDAAEDDPGIQNNVLKFVQSIIFTLFITLSWQELLWAQMRALRWA